jgi:alanine dehydrogenase
MTHVGVPREIKNHEYRVGLTPDGVRELTSRGHTVLVETGAGSGAGFENAQYLACGASIAPDAAAVFDAAELLIKVKEPQLGECKRLRPGQLLFTYLHLAADPEQTRLLMQSEAIAIAYESVTDQYGGLPLLAPMSEVAGRMTIQVGAHLLEKAQGGAGVLLPGVPGVPPAQVLILGGGVVGMNAARIALGMGADVTVADVSLNRLSELDALYGPRLRTLYSTTASIAKAIGTADHQIGAVLVRGGTAPKLITRAMLKSMRPGSVIVDVAIDQGGCAETSRPTTHQEPTFSVDGVLHYCVPNMPGAVPRTSTLALTNATLPYVLKLADKGFAAVAEDVHLRQGLQIHRGALTCEVVAKALGLPYTKFV